jgi:hypothetical protein
MNPRLFRVAALALVALMTMTLASCSKGLDGKYVAAGGVMSIEFKSGKAIVTMAGESKSLDYSVDGDKITIQGPDKGDKPLVLMRMPDGSLKGDVVTFKKES